MRIKLLFCLLAFCISNAVTNAQDIHFGPELGYQNIPTLKSGETQYYQPGYRVGLRIDYGIIKQLSFSTGIYFTNNSKSTSEQYVTTFAEESPFIGQFIEGILGDDLAFLTNIDNTATSSTAMRFMSFPLLLKGDYNGFSATAGISLDKLLSATTNSQIERDILLSQFLDSGFIDLSAIPIDINAALPPESESETSDVKTDLKSLSIGLTLGLGYKLNKFDLNLMYHRGTSDYRNPAAASADPYSSVSFSVAYLFSYRKLRGYQDRATGEML